MCPGQWPYNPLWGNSSEEFTQKTVIRACVIEPKAIPSNSSPLLTPSTSPTNTMSNGEETYIQSVIEEDWDMFTSPDGQEEPPVQEPTIEEFYATLWEWEKELHDTHQTLEALAAPPTTRSSEEDDTPRTDTTADVTCCPEEDTQMYRQGEQLPEGLLWLPNFTRPVEPAPPAITNLWTAWENYNPRSITATSFTTTITNPGPAMAGPFMLPHTFSVPINTGTSQPSAGCTRNDDQPCARVVETRGAATSHHRDHRPGAVGPSDPGNANPLEPKRRARAPRKQVCPLCNRGHTIWRCRNPHTNCTRDQCKVPPTYDCYYVRYTQVHGQWGVRVVENDPQITVNAQESGRSPV